MEHTAALGDNRLIMAVLALALLASACSGVATPATVPAGEVLASADGGEGVAGDASGGDASGGDASGDEASGDEAAARYVVGVDGPGEDVTASFHRFFPDRLTVHPGDTVDFTRLDNGEPHTVTYAPEPRGRPARAGADFFEGGFGGPPRKDMSTPCALSEGLPPQEGCTPAQQQPVPFDGTHSWFSSGGLLGAETFTLELSDDVAPGRYLFVCLIHTGSMQTTVEVVAADAPADDPADVIARGAEQLERERAKADRLVDTAPTAVEGRVTAARTDQTFSVWVNTFSPEETEIGVGGTVSWITRHFHTISFNMPESARPFFERAEDGSVAENALAAAPQGDPSGWDGSGMLNSGLQVGLFPAAEFSVTFTEPGTYPYICLVHFDMEGKVKVGG